MTGCVHLPAGESEAARDPVRGLVVNGNRVATLFPAGTRIRSLPVSRPLHFSHFLVQHHTEVNVL